MYGNTVVEKFFRSKKFSNLSIKYKNVSLLARLLHFLNIFYILKPKAAKAFPAGT